MRRLCVRRLGGIELNIGLEIRASEVCLCPIVVKEVRLYH